MAKNNKVKEMENEKMEETNDVTVEVTEEIEVIEAKPKWSLKKKLLVIGGSAVGLLAGAVALGLARTKDTTEPEGDEGPTEDEYEDSEVGSETDEV